MLEAARGHLRSDPTYREAWEVYRCGFLNQAELVCRVFAIGLLLENRAAAGDDCGDEIDALFDLYARNGYHYADTPCTQPPDIDTLGLMLRLAAHAAQPQRCRDLLAEPLGWLLDHIQPDGEIPVFMARGHEGADASRYVAMVGSSCAGVRAGLLLGLLAHDAQRWRGPLVLCGGRLLAAFARQGAGTLTYYDLPFAAHGLLALAQGLRDAGVFSPDEPLLVAAEQRAVALLMQTRSLARANALDAALLHLASRFPAAAALRDGAWAEVLIRTQRHDGSWDAAPLYVAPCRGNLMNWHASRLATTAFAYRALCSATPAARSP